MAFHYSVDLSLTTSSLFFPQFDLKPLRFSTSGSCFLTNYPHFPSSPWLLGAGWSCSPGGGRGRRGGGGLTDADTKGPNVSASGLYFGFVRIPVCTSLFFCFPPELNFGWEWLGHETKAVIGSLMINPTLIQEKKIPRSFCLFAVAGPTGQRAQSSPAWKRHVGSYCFCVYMCF